MPPNPITIFTREPFRDKVVRSSLACFPSVAARARTDRGVLGSARVGEFVRVRVRAAYEFTRGLSLGFCSQVSCVVKEAVSG